MSHLSEEEIETAAREKGVAPLPAHVSSCAHCQQRLRMAIGRKRLFAGLPEVTLSEVQVRRVEHAVVEEVTRPSRFAWWWLVPVPLAAAAVLALWPRPPSMTVPLNPQPAPLAVKGPQIIQTPLTVIRAQRGARVQQGTDAWATAEVGAVLSAPTLLEGRLTLASAPLPWAFALSGEARMGPLAALEVTRGEVGVSSEASANGEAVTLRAERWVFSSAAQATFWVERTAAEVTLSVTQGEVEAFDSVAATRNTYRAPTRVRFNLGDGVASVLPFVSKDGAVLAVPKQPWSLLAMPSFPAATRWALDGESMDADVNAVLTSTGRHRLEVRKGSAVTASWLDLVAGINRWQPPKPKSKGVEGVVSEALIEVIERELQRSRPRVQSCYEKWLKVDPSANGQFVLVAQVAATGRVEHVSVKGQAMTESATECMEQSLKDMQLPALEEATELEFPMVFKAQ